MASVSGPRNPTIITAPTSSSRVSLGDGEGAGLADGEGEAWRPVGWPAQAAVIAASSRRVASAFVIA